MVFPGERPAVEKSLTRCSGFTQVTPSDTRSESCFPYGISSASEIASLRLEEFVGKLRIPIPSREAELVYTVRPGFARLSSLIHSAQQVLSPSGVVCCPSTTITG